MSNIYPVILSGGVGSRLWPLSRKNFPKQLLSLAGKPSLIQETALRTMGPGFAKPLIICNAEHRFLVSEQIRAISVEPDTIVLEPVGRNTAPAAAIAALLIAEKDPDAVLLLMPADHVIRDHEAFHRAVDVALDLAKRGHLVTFGIRPHGPETGFGYIQRGSALSKEAFVVARFVEKPDAGTARRYIEAGDYYWNSGLFAFSAGTYVSELERLEPEIVAHCRNALSNGESGPDWFLLDPGSFEACKSISIDYAVMEHTNKAAIVPVDMRWSDVGSWAALWDISPKDSDGNVIVGDVLHLGTYNSYLHTDGPLIAVFGVNDLIVVASADAVLVGPKAAAQDVKKIVEQLELRSSDLQTAHRRVHHPWGWSERISQDENFQVNSLSLNSGAALSSPASREWVGHWVVASGTARIISGDKVHHIRENESYILSGADHQLENAGGTSLCVIEVRIAPSSSRRT